jgi:hypothetical protein
MNAVRLLRNRPAQPDVQRALSELSALWGTPDPKPYAPADCTIRSVGTGEGNAEGVDGLRTPGNRDQAPGEAENAAAGRILGRTSEAWEMK